MRQNSKGRKLSTRNLINRTCMSYDLYVMIIWPYDITNY
jgi:hypothetical protein